ncbi:MAG TPA: fumarylacetoacetate hydrolase family protein [Ktedonobacteraceae bacterium]|jgi:2-keto-4-pentenoate hydratase/2-oxohepta-3-ene-1,7-dioic acid hydratase in catechol pathway|nr:fumarylacetoacetate hydrolase family protein [Ktedonobacteraceae bacterium]
MKLGRILRKSLDQSIPRLVAVLPEQDRVFDLASVEYYRLLHSGATPEAALRLSAALFPSSMSAAIAAGPAFLEAARRCLATTPDEQAVFSLQEVTWLPALDPPVMRDCMSFEQHMVNSFGLENKAIPAVCFELPVSYKINHLSIIANEQEVPWPDYSQAVDYELEVGFVVGRQGQNLTPEEARSYLFGVTIFNDFSARDIQRRETAAGFGPSKSKDFATAVGPWITTTDELDVYDLEMSARINGEEWSHGSTSAMLWKVEELIAYISKVEGVRPGELIGSGTAGFGCGMELRRKLQPGDLVELEVGGIGILRNRLGIPQAQGWMPTPRIPRLAQNV